MGVVLIFVHITGSWMTFEAARYYMFGWLVCDVDHELRPELSADEVVAIEPGDFPSPVSRTFNVPFTRIHRAVGPDVLLCTGSDIRYRNEELRLALEAITQAA